MMMPRRRSIYCENRNDSVDYGDSELGKAIRVRDDVFEQMSSLNQELSSGVTPKEMKRNRKRFAKLEKELALWTGAISILAHTYPGKI